MKKRLMCLFLTLVMLFGLMPMGVFADEEGGDELSEPIGKVRVIVENNTCDEGTANCWAEDAEFWDGTLIDKKVDLYEGDKPTDCIVRALGDSYSITGADSGYITEINGLQADTVTYYGGWMVTLNDWFTNETIDNYTLEDGDELNAVYTMNWGADVGSISSDTTKTLKALSITGDGELTKSFSSGVKSYELALGEGVEEGTIKIAPTAYNKNFQVRIYKSTGSGNGFDPTKAGDYKRNQEFDVSVGDVILIVVGYSEGEDGTYWPSMNNGTYGGAEEVDGQVYSISIVETETVSAEDTAFNGFFTALDGIATVTNGDGEGNTTLPFEVTEDETALVSTNEGIGYSCSLITLSFSKKAKLSFEYKTSSESKYDFLRITRGVEVLNGDYSAKADYSGEMTEFKTYSVIVNAGQALKLEYYKDSSGNAGDDCVWLKGFTATLPNTVTFHANYEGADPETAEQGIFGTDTLEGNDFERDGYRFAGWAESENGDVVYEDGDEITLTTDKELYAVWTKVWEVTFPSMPDGAEITVKQDGTTVKPDSEGVWILADGSYTYSASLWGYVSAEDVSFTVSGADLASEATLTAKTRYSLTFSITPTDAEASITLKNSESSEMTSTGNAKVYNVPDDTYSYVVEADGYKKAKGSVEISGDDETVSIALVASNAWNGTTSEPAQISGVYQISNAQELAWLAETVNGGETELDAVLTADITVNEEADSEDSLAWIAIGTTANAYSGSFDGKGHTISGLLISSGDNVGLFGVTGADAGITNLVISASSVSGTSNVGLAVGKNAGTVSGILVKESNVAGKDAVGGIVGTNSGTVEACGNDSAEVKQNVQVDRGIGGIVGTNSGSVSLCYNKANIVRGHNATNYAYFGGIVGYITGGTVESCYNLGTVDRAYRSGGIVGNFTSGTLKYCYNAGSVNSNGNAVVGYGSATVTSCFYLDSCGATDTKATSKTAEELKALSPELGGSFEAKAGSYPILKWENPNAAYAIYITVTPADAQVTLTLGDDTITPSVDGGVYSFTGLEPGTYDWSASYEAGDYAEQSGSITVSKADVYKTVELQARVYPVVFTVTPKGAELTLTSGETTLAAASSEDGTITYQLKNGDYSWSAEAFGYISQTGNAFTVNKAGQSITVTLVRGEAHTLSFTGIPEGATVTVSHAEAGVQTANADGSYTLAPAEYSYTVKLKGYKTVKGTVTISDSNETVPISMVQLTAWDGTQADSFAGGDGTADNPYEIETGEQLYRLAWQVALGNGADKHYILTADIDMGGTKSFTSIGSSSSDKFSGTLDGDGHIISNILIDNYEDNNGGLFGYLTGTVKDLTLDNLVLKNCGNYGGAFVGYGTGTIENCVVLDSSVTAARYVGGLAGYFSGTIKNSAVLRTSVSGTDYVGGFVGQAKTVTESYVSGANVTATGTSYGYAGGFVGIVNASSTSFKNCFARGTVSGTTYVGGFVGGNSGYSSASLNNCYAVVDVTASSTGYGLFAGKESSINVTSCFYSSDSSASGSGTAASKGTAKTLAELKSSAILTSLGSSYAILANEAENTYVNAGLPYLVNTYYETIKPKTLAAPTVTWSDKTASWTAVTNAKSYDVKLMLGTATVKSLSTKDTSIDFTTPITLSGSGSYTVSVTAVGDGEKYISSAAGISAALDVTINSALVTFNVTADSDMADGYPTITLEMADGTKLSLENGVAKNVPSGTYTYSVYAPTFGRETGSITVETSPITKSIALTFTTVWDGETKIEPSYVEATSTYQISNSYELAWFRDKVNTDVEAASTALNSPAYNAVLTADIDLGNHEWIPISKVIDTGAKKGYVGTFDGADHEITGLKAVGVEVTSYGSTRVYGAGLFGYLYTGGKVKDLEVSGAFQVVQYSAGVVAMLAGGTVENCVSHVNLTSVENPATNQYVGGVVGYMTNYTDKSSFVTGCGFDGTITLPKFNNVGGVVGGGSYGTGIINCWSSGTVSAKNYVGGVVGNGGVPVTACYNTGAVTGEDYVGGVAGWANKELSDCYNTGAVTGVGEKYGVGGIVGQLHSAYGGKVSGSYNSGTVTATGEKYGAIVGAKGDTSTVVARSYYLVGTSTRAIGSNASDDDESASVSAAELSTKRIVGLLGGNFAKLSGTAYPVLKWQSTDAKSVVTFVLTPDDAAVVLKNGDATVTTDESAAYALDAGEYAYSVTKSGYNSASDTVTVADKSQKIAVTLAVETFTVSFTVTPEDALVTVYDESGKAVGTGASQSLPRGSYTYKVTRFGYAEASGSFTVNGAAVTIDPITLTAQQLYDVTLSITYEGDAPESTEISVKSGDTVVGTTASLSLPDGEYTYSVKASGYFESTGSFTVSGAAKNVSVSMLLRTTWDGTTAEAATTGSDGYYEIDSAEKLVWFQQQVSAGTGTAYNARLTADIHINDELSDNTWTYIGTYSNKFTGVFDGAGHAIYGLDDSLFYITGEGSQIKNVKVYGEIDTTGETSGRVIGGIAVQGYGAFEKCENHINITTHTINPAGGIVGRLYSAGSITSCANLGNITSTATGDATGGYGLSSLAYLGGIVGQTYGSVSGCYNAGEVKSTRENYGGIGGIVGAFPTGTTGTITVTDCYNTGKVSGWHRFGGIIGSGAGGSVSNCYNVGTITCLSDAYNPFGGAVAGSLTESSTTGTTNNCYYLENSYTYTHGGNTVNCGVGYGTDATVSKTASEMKLDAFVNALGDSFNFDSEKINSGYPVLDWQGGRVPNVSEDEAAVAADKAALTVTPLTVERAMTLTLASTGANGSTITWKSGNASVISDSGVVTLPTDNNTTVVLTATIKKGEVSDTKTFNIYVKTRAEADQTSLNTLVSGLKTILSPVCGTDTNINTFVKSAVVAAMTEDTTFTAADITVSLVSAGNRTYPASDTAVHFGEDGTISYFYEDPSASVVNGCAVIRNVKLRIATASGASAEFTAQVNLPWDVDKVKAALKTQIADNLTFDVIKGENTSADNVTKDLVLPAKLTDASWATISWASDNDAVVVEAGVYVVDDSTGIVTQQTTSKTGNVTATISFNKSDPTISISKDINITVPASGSGVDHQAIINAALEKYTLDKLTYADLDETLDTAGVKGDISLMRPSALGIDGSVYSVTVTASGSAVTINGYKANVYRPLPGADAQSVTLSVTITCKANTAITGTKTIGTITIAPLSQSEIDAEIALMNEVKAHYFDGIRDTNASANAITANLHAFQEAYRGSDGKIVWVYSYANRTYSGIVPSDFPEYDSMSGMDYRTFKSSNSSVIAPENLLVTRPAEDTKVTISSYLSSQKFARYAELYPDNTDLQKLSMQLVSVELTVLAKDKTQSDVDQILAKEVEDQIAAIGTVTLDKEDEIAAARAAYKALTEAQQALVSNTAVLEAAEAELARLKQEQAALEADKAAAKAVEDMIAAIGTVTLESEASIKAARKAFNALTAAQQALVSNISVLTAAEARLNELKNAAGYLTQMNSVLAYIMESVGSPSIGTMSGEWAVLAEARGNVSAPEWYSAYVDNLSDYLEENGMVFDKITDYSRIALALTSIGLDASDFEANGTSYDFISKLTEKNGDSYIATTPGTTSTAFAIIAIDSKPYTVSDTAREALLSYLLGRQLSSGAWDINDVSSGADLDATAMALTALAPYKDRTDVKAAIEKGIAYLSDVQSASNGGFGTPEADAQVITALSALGIDCRTDSRFVKSGNNPISSILRYMLSSGGFVHTIGSTTVNKMSTEQAAYALVAYWRFDTSKNRLYDMSDAVSMLPAASEAQDVIDMISELGTVTNCRRSTYLKLQAIESAYSNLSEAEQALVSNYDEFKAQQKKFNSLLSAYISDKLETLSEYYLSLDEDDYSNDQWRKITSAYRTGQQSIRSAAYAEQADEALSEALDTIEKYAENALIEVSFRLIGDFVHASGSHDTYVTWIETTDYELTEGSTVYDLFTEAVGDAGLSQRGASDGYVTEIRAPYILGGYWLGEFDNGTASGWMYTVNGKHSGLGLKDYELDDGDEVIWHYVDNYKTEEKSETWLEAEDISPEEFARMALDDILTVDKHGSASPEIKFTDLGKNITFTFTPDEGYQVADVIVDGESVGAVERYTYKSLSAGSRISVSFEPIEDIWFEDVTEADWFYDDVMYVAKAGLFTGTGDHVFSPNREMTRAMLVTVLYRLEGEPQTASTTAFTDTATNQWYSKAVSWASLNGIVTGVGDGCFNPNGYVTREQMAAILYRYAQYKGYSTAATAELTGFSDAGSISAYALSAISWANASGLINGVGNSSLAPQGNATRAQVAAILHRFVVNTAAK